MNNPSVSVIVPIYNVERFFEKCLHSLFGQTLANIEYIFVNDCTQDNSMLLLSKIIEQYPGRKDRIKIIVHDRNMGSGLTRRDGMKAATGEYVIFCDSDDRIEPDMYEKMYEVATSEHADLVMCEILVERGNETNKWTFENKAENDKYSMKNLNWFGVYASLCNKLIKRSLYVDNNIYPFDGINMWEDTGVNIRLRYFSKNTVKMREPFYHYIRHEFSMVSNPKIHIIDEQIMCAKLIESFFKEQTDGEEYFLLVQNIKFFSKHQFMDTESIKNIKRWKNIFPETHKHILKYTNFSRRDRIKYWLSANGLYSLCLILCKLKRKICRINENGH